MNGSSRRRSLSMVILFFFSSRRRHTRSLCDWSSDVCSSDLFSLFVVGLFGLVAAQRILQVHGHQPEQADHEQRECDGRDRERREQRGAPEGEQGLANREVHGVAAWSRGSSTAESYTSAPSCSSITR